MKKFAIFLLAALMLAAFVAPASALENKFGGYHRFVLFTNQNFTGEDESEAMDKTVAQTRTRLYYTAILHDDLKLVTKFEIDWTWGSGDMGDIGADGNGQTEVKNSYVDFNLAPLNFKFGAHGGKIGRGFILNDDFSGATITYKGEGITVPFLWVKAYEGDTGNNEQDFDMYAIAPSFTAGEMMTVNPYFAYAYSDDASASGFFGDAAEDVSVYYLGIDLDVKMDAANFWATAIYEGGSVDYMGGGDADIKAYLGAVGGSIDFGGQFGLNGEFFYASGDDGEDDDIETYSTPGGAMSYTYSEILGEGAFWDQYPLVNGQNWIGPNPSNMWAAKIGASFKPMDDLSVFTDLWYMQLAEVPEGVDDDLGTEVNVTLSYNLLENLNLKLIGAYLFAGDAINNGVEENDANPYEFGSQLSLSW